MPLGPLATLTPTLLHLNDADQIPTSFDGVFAVEPKIPTGYACVDQHANHTDHRAKLSAAPEAHDVLELRLGKLEQACGALGCLGEFDLDHQVEGYRPNWGSWVKNCYAVPNTTKAKEPTLKTGANEPEPHPTKEQPK